MERHSEASGGVLVTTNPDGSRTWRVVGPFRDGLAEGSEATRVVHRSEICIANAGETGAAKVRVEYAGTSRPADVWDDEVAYFLPVPAEVERWHVIEVTSKDNIVVFWDHWLIPG